VAIDRHLSTTALGLVERFNASPSGTVTKPITERLVEGRSLWLESLD
jgi:hypothetical protein